MDFSIVASIIVSLISVIGSFVVVYLIPIPIKLPMTPPMMGIAASLRKNFILSNTSLTSPVPAIPYADSFWSDSVANK